MTTFDNHIKNIDQGSVLEQKEMEDVMSIIMHGEANDAQIEALLRGLSVRGEAVSEITGAAMVLRRMSSMIKAPSNALDCCGTGGDGVGTYNISTAVALVSAACGVPVAKHGNRASSSKSGAADVLEALGVNLDMPIPRLEKALEEINFCFLMAPHHHQAMKHVMPVRKKIGQRTIFNLLGPLANPAGTKFQLIGVYDKKWVRPMAEALKNLGTTRAWVVHGHDGLDEITITDATDIAILDNGKITERTLTPADFGLQPAKMEDIQGGDATENAKALLALLNGQPSAYRDIVLANAAAVLNISGQANDLIEGVDLARSAIDNNNAINVLKRYINFSNEVAS
ncbi:MAG: anthranilate phosphoribosyltransferase [Alphaproteobacteria bacterium]|nr:anthranilate phosphoribosyltransferase [Alphaproteobacteria bacterium]